MSGFWNYAKNRFIYDTFIDNNLQEDPVAKKQAEEENRKYAERVSRMSEEELEFMTEYYKRASEDLDKTPAKEDTFGGARWWIRPASFIAVNYMLYSFWAEKITPKGETFLNDSLDLVVSEGPSIGAYLKDVNWLEQGFAALALTWIISGLIGMFILYVDIKVEKQNEGKSQDEIKAEKKSKAREAIETIIIQLAIFIGLPLLLLYLL